LNLMVLDASVAAKWFLPPRDEQLVSEALKLFRDYDAGRVRLIVPDLFWVEFGSIARKAVRRQRWSQSEADTAVTRVRELELESFDCKSLLRAAFNIASVGGRSVYDAIYVALATETRSTMITADERLVNALGSRFPVRWLGAFSIT
jgi:predicted nucleic acid-binding protein